MTNGSMRGGLAAMRTFCPTCGTKIDGTRQYCATCGVFLGWKTWAAPLDARVCPKCEAPNAPDRSSCGHCFTSLLTGGDDRFFCGTPFLDLPHADAASDVGPPRPAGACHRCGVANPAGEVFCGNCGSYLDWEHEVRQPEPPPVPSQQVPR
jgi:hypothetical protein